MAERLPAIVEDKGPILPIKAEKRKSPDLLSKFLAQRMRGPSS